MMQGEYIQTVIDKAINFSTTYLRGLQEPAYLVPEKMIDYSKEPPAPGIVFWKPVPVDFMKKSFDEYEQKIGFSLPVSYKYFLVHKYFISLNFGHPADFFVHTHNWVDDNYDEIISRGLSNVLAEGFIPFARHNNEGWFCFNANTPAGNNNEYTIVIYTHESGVQPYPSISGQFTFMDLVQELENTLENWKQTRLSNS